MSNIVFIATSLDGYIAGKNNEIDWLEAISNPDNIDMGYQAHMESIDALVIGRNTMELVASMDIEWPYSKPVFVLSKSLKKVPDKLEGKAFLVKGDIKSINNELNEKGYNNLYIDGGLTVQSFLKEDLVDELIITIIPILLGSGIRLFGELDRVLEFRCTKSEKYSNGICQNRFERYSG